MGAGHDGAAKELSRRLEASGHRVEVVDFLDAVAFHIGPLLRWFYQVQLRMAPWSYELSYKMAPLLRAPAVMLDTVPHAAQAEAHHQGVPARRHRVGVPAGVARARAHAAQEAAARARCSPTSPTSRVHSLWVHRGIDRHLAVSEISAEAATSRGGKDARARGPLVSDRFRDADVRPRRGAHQPRPRARRPRRPRRRRVVGRGRRHRHRRGDRAQRRVPPDHGVRARRQPPRPSSRPAATAPSSAGPTRCPRS